MREPGVPCKVVYSHEFDRQFEALDPDLARREEVLRGIEWGFALTPGRGRVCLVAALTSRGPRFGFYATVGEDEATVESVERID